MKNNQLEQLNNGLRAVSKLKGVKFAYAVSKNLKKVEAEINVLMKAIAPDESFQGYEQERVEVCMKFAAKDEGGKAVLKDGNYVIENREEFDKEIKLLQERFKSAIDLRSNQVNEFNELLKEDCLVNFHKISIEEVPEDITAEQLTAIMPIIKDD